MCTDVLKIAVGELGPAERPRGSRRTGYGRWYGLEGQPWAVMFVQWCFAQAGVPLPCRTASCTQLLNWYRSFVRERLTNEALPGDIVLCLPERAGIVECAADGVFTVIEGDAPGEAGLGRSGGVYRRTWKRSQVSACIHP